MFWQILIFGAGAGAQSEGQPGSPKMKFSKHSHVIYRRKAFLMLISDFRFVLNHSCHSSGHIAENDFQLQLSSNNE